MSNHPTRRALLMAAPSVSLLSAQASVTNVPDRGPALAADLAKEFVVAGHANLKRTKELLELQPGLLNACWDWGGGDFETGLGAAAHMGQRDIARFLLENGARLDLFAAAMLGKLDIVKAALTAFPEAVHIPGPHGIPLIAHARAGGDYQRHCRIGLAQFERLR